MSNESAHSAPTRRVAGALIAFLISLAICGAAETQREGLASEIELMCLTEQPAIVQGESTTLRAWASTPDGQPITTRIAFSWNVDAGSVDANGPSARWNLASVNVQSNGAQRVTATVTAARQGERDARCVVEVQIGAKETTAPARGVIRGEDLLSAKRYLFPGDVETPGFGLYSYLLLSAPPKDADEKARYLKTIEAYLLMLQNVDDYLARHVPPSSLNATYIPLKVAPKAATTNVDWAASVLEVYDYATAGILLRRVNQDLTGGPFLISVLGPLSRMSQSDLSARLHENLTGVTPALAWDWVRWFTYLAAQQRSWSQTTLQRLGLTVRNVIAVGGTVTPQVAAGVASLIQFKPKP